jgi:hypothetical protein
MKEQLAKEYVVFYLPFFKWEVVLEFDTNYFPVFKDIIK